MEQIVNDPNVDEYTIESLEKYHNYEIKLAAYNGEGIGPFSRPITVFVGEASKYDFIFKNNNFPFLIIIIIIIIII